MVMAVKVMTLGYTHVRDRLSTTSRLLAVGVKLLAQLR